MRTIRERGGESLVEILVAGTVFLFLLAALHTGVRFATASQHKTRALLERAAEVQKKVREADPREDVTIGASPVPYRFTGPGGGFTIEVEHRTRALTLADGTALTFYLYGGVETAGEPGAGP